MKSFNEYVEILREGKCDIELNIFPIKLIFNYDKYNNEVTIYISTLDNVTKKIGIEDIRELRNNLNSLC